MKYDEMMSDLDKNLFFLHEVYRLHHTDIFPVAQVPERAQISGCPKTSDCFMIVIITGGNPLYIGRPPYFAMVSSIYGI